MNYYDRQKIARDRLIELGKQIWSLLTDDEVSNYCCRGTLSFLEDVARIVGYDIDPDDDVSIDYLHSQIIS